MGWEEGEEHRRLEGGERTERERAVQAYDLECDRGHVLHGLTT